MPPRLVSDRNVRRRGPMPEARRQCGKCGAVKHIDKFPKSHKKYDWRRYICSDCWNAHYRVYHRKRRAALKAAIIAAYGGKCACCGEREPKFLCLDHIDGGGSRARKIESQERLMYRLRREGFPTGEHQILCHNCNFAKWAYGKCPHNAS